MLCLTCGLPPSNARGSKITLVCLCRNRPSISKTLPLKCATLRGYVLMNLGIEIEASNWQGRALPDGHRGPLGGVPGHWIHDGSVTSGVEWASEPMTVKPTRAFDAYHTSAGLVNDLLSIADAFDTHNLATDSTCGLHVHVDQRDISYWELVKIWANYIAIQPMIYRFSHPDREAMNVRRNRTYCNRYQTKLLKTLHRLLGAGTPELKAWITDQFFEASSEVLCDTARRQKRRNNTDNPRFNTNNGGPTNHLGITPRDLTALKRYKYHNNRYYGLNIMPWFNQGTIEWRTQGHPYNSNDIVLWPLACCNITNKLLNGPLLCKPLPNDLGVFLQWLQAPEEINNYLEGKYLQFKTAHTQTTVIPTYKELV